MPCTRLSNNSEGFMVDRNINGTHVFDISNELWRRYEYANGDVLEVTDAVGLMVQKNPTGDHHRLIIKRDGEQEEGMYVKPGWLAIRWTGKDGTHGITF